MTIVKKYEGNLVATSVAEYERGNSEPATMYDYWRIESQNQDIFLQRIIVPAHLDSIIKIGTTTTFYLVELSLPTILFGRKSMYLVFGIKTNGRQYEAIAQVKNLLRAIKFSALKLFFVGIPAMFLAGIGLLLWIMAARIVTIKLPLHEMRQF